MAAVFRNLGAKLAVYQVLEKHYNKLK